MSDNFGDILDAIMEAVPGDAPALVHGDRVITWAETDRRSNNLARALLARGIEYGDKVAFYLHNCPEYTETLAACFKGRLAHVNVNFRYQEEELHYIFDNSDATVVVYGSEFAEQITALKPQLDKVKVFVEVASGAPVRNEALSYEDLVAEGDGSPLGIERSPDDLLFLYTGGTTGMPKGVMWPHGTLRSIQIQALKLLGPVPETIDEVVAALKETPTDSCHIPVCPLMHGTGLFTTIPVMCSGGTVVTLDNDKGFDPHALWAAVDRYKVTGMAIVGDAFAKPMLRALEETPGAYDLSSLQSMTSSGVMFSLEVKQGLLKHIPQVILADSFGASEAVGFGTSLMAAGVDVSTAKFSIGETCKVFTEDGREVVPGSGEPGFIAQGGHIPLGYYKDQEKTDSVYKVINGHRYSIPGDWCTVEEDGTITLLGRGSVCINSGGEKIYPEEIEEILKEHDAVHDALVVGVPDEKWGQAVIAVVECPKEEPGADALRDHVRGHLAAYKVPKQVLFKGDLERAPNGKADYKLITAYAKSTLGIA